MLFLFLFLGWDLRVLELDLEFQSHTNTRDPALCINCKQKVYIFQKFLEGGGLGVIKKNDK